MSDTPENNKDKQEPELGLFDLLYQGLIDLSKLLQDLRFAAVLLVLVAIGTLIGTALPQTPMAGPMAAQEMTKAFGERAFSSIIKPLGFDVVFHTAWYRFLMLLLVTSVTLCAWARTKTASALTKKRSPLTSEKGVDVMNFTGSENFADIESASEWIKKNIASRGYKLNSEEKGDEVHYFGMKNPLSKWMLVIMHYSFAIILFGAIIGWLGGIQEEASVMEGESWTTKDGKASIRLNDYWMEYNKAKFPDEMSLFMMGMPSDYKSDVDALDADGNTVKTTVIEVNYPLTLNGYKFYQLRWVFEPILSVSKGDEVVDRFVVDQDRPFQLADSGKVMFIPSNQVISGKLVDKKAGVSEEIPPICILYEVDMHEREDNSTPIVPAKQAGNGTGIFKLGDQVEIPTASGVYTLSFDGMREYSVFQVKRDPGVGIVFFGFILCVVGGSWGLLLPFGTSRAIVLKKGKDWIVKWGTTLKY